MIRGEKLTAIIPARGGSKGIPGKNLYKIEGETLVERTIKLAKSSKKIDEIYVSTDHPEIYSIADKFNCAPQKLRPNHLASDKALTIDVVKHLLTEVEIDMGYVLLLQVTTPLRNENDLKNILNNFECNTEADAITSVTEHKSPHPQKLLKYQGQYLAPYLDNKHEFPRQELENVYALNGGFYLTSINTIKNKNTFLPEKTISYEMPPDRSINLDEPFDLKILEYLIATKLHL